MHCKSLWIFKPLSCEGDVYQLFGASTVARARGIQYVSGVGEWRARPMVPPPCLAGWLAGSSASPEEQSTAEWCSVVQQREGERGLLGQGQRGALGHGCALTAPPLGRK